MKKLTENELNILKTNINLVKDFMDKNGENKKFFVFKLIKNNALKAINFIKKNI